MTLHLPTDWQGVLHLQIHSNVTEFRIEIFPELARTCLLCGTIGDATSTVPEVTPLHLMGN